MLLCNMPQEVLDYNTPHLDLKKRHCSQSPTFMLAITLSSMCKDHYWSRKILSSHNMK